MAAGGISDSPNSGGPHHHGEKMTIPAGLAGSHTIPPPKTSGPATGGQQLSATANQFVDKIDPFSKRGNSRRRRRLLNSSRYQTENEPDLVQLPLIKGIALKITNNYII